MKKVNNHSSVEHPILKLNYKDPTCEYKTNNEQSLALHNKELHEKNLCRICNTITVGSPHRKDHEKTFLGPDTTHPTIIQGTQPTLKKKTSSKEGVGTGTIQNKYRK